jgi:hypothetical protein
MSPSVLKHRRGERMKTMKLFGFRTNLAISDRWPLALIGKDKILDLFEVTLSTP